MVRCRPIAAAALCASLALLLASQAPAVAQNAEKKPKDAGAKQYREFEPTFDAKGFLTHRGAIGEKDPQIPIYLGGTKGFAAVRYVVPVERGRTYTIVMRAGGMSAYLLVTDMKNGEIAHRGSYNQKAEIVVRPSFTGKIFVYATTEGGIGPYDLTIRGPMQRAVTSPPAIPATPPTDGEVTHVRVPFANGYSKGAIWAADGKSFFLLQRNGKLASFESPSLKKIRETNFNEMCTSLALSSEGLLVSLFSGDILLIDPNDFSKVKKRFAIPAIERVTASPNSKFAVVGSLQAEHSLTVIDLEKGAIVAKLPNLNPLYVTMNPDGRRVYGVVGATLTSWTITETGEPIEEQVSEDIALQPQGIFVSPTGDFVCVPGNEGNPNAEGHPKIEPFTTYVFGTNDLRKPLFSIPSGQWPRAVGLDTKSGYVLAQNAAKALKLYSFKGEFLADHDIAPPGTHAQHFVVSPQGGEALAVFSLYVEYVRLPTPKKR